MEDKKINLCLICWYNYPDCPADQRDIEFGNGYGNDNICKCQKYVDQKSNPENSRNTRQEENNEL